LVPALRQELIKSKGVVMVSNFTRLPMLVLFGLSITGTVFARQPPAVIRAQEQVDAASVACFDGGIGRGNTYRDALERREQIRMAQAKPLRSLHVGMR
jgi:hypothetical protein